MMALDECPSGDSDYQYAKSRWRWTLRWLRRGWDHYKAETDGKYELQLQVYFPIVQQGCTYKDLRQESAKFVADLGKPTAMLLAAEAGEPTEKMYEMIEIANEILPKDKPRYLMGVGTPANTLEGNRSAASMMDCVMPTRNGRNGMLFTKNAYEYAQQEAGQTISRRQRLTARRRLTVCIVGLISAIYLLARDSCHADCVDPQSCILSVACGSSLRSHILAGDFKAWKDETVVRVMQRL